MIWWLTTRGTNLREYHLLTRGSENLGMWKLSKNKMASALIPDKIWERNKTPSFTNHMSKVYSLGVHRQVM